MSILGFFKKNANLATQVEKETMAEIPVQRGTAISKRIELDFRNESIIETYHGLTTSKPLQLRCFQSG